MTLDEYFIAAMRTASPLSTLTTVGLGLCGEAGEVADMVKKIQAQGHELDKAKMVKELGDVLWYLALAAKVLDVPLNEIAQANINKLLERYPGGFDSSRSKSR